MANAKTYCNIATGDDYIVLMGDKSATTDVPDSDGVNSIVKALTPDMIIGDGDWETTTTIAERTCVGLGGIKKYSTPGNHDMDLTGVNRNSFNLTFGGGRYKKIRAKNIDFFLYDLYLSDDETSYYTYENASARNEASFKGTTQGIWLLAELAASTATWKIVMFHQCCTDWTSGDAGFNLRLDGMKWDWKALGVDVLITGHEHFFERLIKDTGGGNLPIINLGTTAALQIDPAAAVVGSQYLANINSDADFHAGGIWTCEATATSLTLKLYAVKADYTLSGIKDTLSLSK